MTEKDVNDRRCFAEADLGRFGVWTFGAVEPDTAREIEKLGYGALWVGGSPAGDLAAVEPILAATETLQVATGIVNVWTAPAAEVAESYHRIEKAFPGPVPARDRHRPPRAHRGVPQALRRPRRVPGCAGRGQGTDQPAGARGPGPQGARARGRAERGAHPYLTTPEHTAQAHALIGNSVYLVPEHKVVLTRDAEQAREIGRQTVEFYLGLSNYLNNWKRLGFTADDIARPGSDKLIDAVVGARHAGGHRGPPARARHVGRRPRGHPVLGGPDQLIPTLAELAGPLGLTATG